MPSACTSALPRVLATAALVVAGSPPPASSPRVGNVTFDKSSQKYIVHVSVPVNDGDAVIGELVAGIDVAKVN